MNRLMAQLGRPKVFWSLVAAVLLLRLGMAFLPGYVNDVQSYKSWALGVAQSGLPDAYAKTQVDYPPLYLYILWVIGKLWWWIQGAGEARDSAWLTFLIKSPHWIFDLGLGFWLRDAVNRFRLWGNRFDDLGGQVAAGNLAALAFWLNPAVLFGSAYWGQPDGVHSFFAFGAISCLAAGGYVAGGGLLSAGGLMKPLAAPLVPLLAGVAGIRGGWRGVWKSGAAGLAVALIAFSPYWLTGRIGPVLNKVLLDIEAMPFTSVNGHTLWWILGPWRDANAAWLGPLSAKQISLALFLSTYAALAGRAWLHRSRLGALPIESFAPWLYRNAAAITAAFFFLSTHMHENHLFMAIPFLLATAGRSRGALWLAVGASLASFANMALHDLYLPHHLPFGLSAESPTIDPHLGRPFTWLQLIGSFFNAVLVATVALGSLRLAWKLPEAQGSSHGSYSSRG